MKETRIVNSVLNIPVKQIVELAANSRPKITGGSIVSSTAYLGLSLVLLALEMSAKQSPRSGKKDLLIHIEGLRKNLSLLEVAANEDLKIFRRFKRISARTAEDKGRYRLALLQAIESPLKVAAIINDCLSLTSACTIYCSPKVLSDLGAGGIMLHAALMSILLLAEDNFSSLPEKERIEFANTKERVEQEAAYSSGNLLLFLRKNDYLIRDV